jgi:hypothetical protein
MCPYGPILAHVGSLGTPWDPFCDYLGPIVGICWTHVWNLNGPMMGPLRSNVWAHYVHLDGLSTCCTGHCMLFHMLCGCCAACRPRPTRSMRQARMVQVAHVANLLSYVVQAAHTVQTGCCRMLRVLRAARSATQALPMPRRIELPTPWLHCECQEKCVYRISALKILCSLLKKNESKEYSVHKSSLHMPADISLWRARMSHVCLSEVACVCRHVPPKALDTACCSTCCAAAAPHAARAQRAACDKRAHGPGCTCCESFIVCCAGCAYRANRMLPHAARAARRALCNPSAANAAPHRAANAVAPL